MIKVIKLNYTMQPDLINGFARLGWNLSLVIFLAMTCGTERGE